MNRTINILAIDDDADILAIVELALGIDTRMAVRTVSTAEDALALLLEGQWRPDCILLDRRIGGIDGRQLLAEIRRVPLHVTTPVVLLTAAVSHADMESYDQLDIQGVIAKPFDPLTLAERVRARTDR